MCGVNADDVVLLSVGQPTDIGQAIVLVINRCQMGKTRILSEYDLISSKIANGYRTGIERGNGRGQKWCQGLAGSTSCRTNGNCLVCL